MTWSEPCSSMRIYRNYVFWFKALQHAVYIKNHLPHSVISYNTPFSLWREQLITLIDHIRPLGCIIYAEIPKEHRPTLLKYLPRAYKGCLLLQLSPWSNSMILSAKSLKLHITSQFERINTLIHHNLKYLLLQHSVLCLRHLQIKKFTT